MLVSINGHAKNAKTPWGNNAEEIFAELKLNVVPRFSSFVPFALLGNVTERRTNEVGVRKVLGASVVSLWGLLSKEFVLLVGLSVLIATPIAWYAMHNWLQNYAYRTALDWWIFALTGGSALLIALLTISYQVLKAANANPARNLHSE